MTQLWRDAHPGAGGVRSGDSSPAQDLAGTLLAGTPEPGQVAVEGPVDAQERARVFAAVLDVAADAVIVTEAEPREAPGPRIVYANPAFTHHTGYTAAEALGRDPRFLQGPQTCPEALATIRRALQRWRPVQVELLNYRKDGSVFWTELSIAPLANERGWFTHWVSVQRDITDRKQREEQAQVEFRLVRDVLASLPSQTAVLDESGTIIATNDAWTAFWTSNGGNGESGLVGSNYLAVCDAVVGDCAQEAAKTAAGLRQVIGGQRETYVLDYECSSPTERRWFHLQVVPLQGDAGGRRRRVVISHSDITARKQGELALAHQAHHDALTGLANRVLLLSRLDGMLAVRGPEADVALLFLDLDGFKSVNDSLGHVAGDDLLRIVAARLVATAREQDVVGRLGGDEFVVCCGAVDTAQAVALGERLAAALALPLQVGGLELRLSVSIGVAMSRPGSRADELLRDADAAMYQAKDRGRGRVEVFFDELRDQAGRRLQVTAGLRAALEDQQLVLHFQPIVELPTGRVVEREALLRWQREDRLCGPHEFLDVAAEAGLLVDIGAWVLHSACAAAASWARAGAPVPVAVNVAPQQLLRPGLERVVADALAANDLPAHLLVLEVTEQGVLAEETSAREVLSAVRATGVRVALDDFGTGFSSLSNLARLPVDVLKVDRQFVAGTGPTHDAILRAVGTLGRTLGLHVVAEGIETAAQEASAVAAGCTHGQGWLYGRPVPSPTAVEDRAGDRPRVPVPTPRSPSGERRSAPA